MNELEHVLIIFIAFIALALSHSLGATKMKRKMMRENHAQLSVFGNLCSSILRERGGAGWETFEPYLKYSLNITEEACHHNCDLNRNHHFQLQHSSKKTASNPPVVAIGIQNGSENF